MRELKDLISIGKATLDDFNLLGIHKVSDLKRQKAKELYQKLCDLRGIRLDPCCEDVFRAAIEQARSTKLPKEKCQWWYWSRIRKEGR